VAALKAPDLFVQQFYFHGRFTEFSAPPGNFTLTAIGGLFFYGLLARLEERLTPA
jgi:hypothetical protein